METYKLHKDMPALTKDKWIDLLPGYYEKLFTMKLTGDNYGREELIALYDKIVKTFNVKTI